MSNSIKTRAICCNGRDSCGLHHIYNFNLICMFHNSITQNALFDLFATISVSIHDTESGRHRFQTSPELVSACIQCTGVMGAKVLKISFVESSH